LLVALGWDAGPSIIALFVGVALLILFVFPPAYSLSFGQTSEIIELLLYMFSAHPGAQEITRQAGADDFVAKPFEINLLLNKIAQYLK